MPRGGRYPLWRPDEELWDDMLTNNPKSAAFDEVWYQGHPEDYANGPRPWTEGMCRLPCDDLPPEVLDPGRYLLL